jgi:mercuric ion transport protein
MKNMISTHSMTMLTALASCLCCITPVLAVLAGTSGAAGTFSGMEPARPFLVDCTVLLLGFAWYQHLKQPNAKVDCGCESTDEVSFWKTRAFLSITTIITGLLLGFPTYSNALFPKPRYRA